MTKYLRKCFRVCAVDSPNVIAGETLRRKHPDWPDERVDAEAYKVGLPGLIGWQEWKDRLRTLDPQRIAVSLNALWYKGSEVKLFPEDWLKRAADFAAVMGHQAAEALGCDPGEGAADTCWTVIGRKGLIELLREKSEDTSAIVNKTLGLMKRWNLRPEQVMFDAGGGGRQHADRLRAQGFAVRVVGFGEAVSIQEPRRKGVWQPYAEKVEKREDRQFLKNRRAEMYWDLAQTNVPPSSFGIPWACGELHRQLSCFPRCYDEEGKFFVPPKGDPILSREERLKKGKPTLIDLVGCSPDHADSLAVAHHCMTHPKKIMKAGAL